MKSPRYWEIDLIRGLAVVGMVTYHYYFDIDALSLPLTFLAKITAITFLFLVGCSFSLSTKKYNQNFFPLYKHTFFRAAKTLVAASVITLVTYFVSPDFTVRFGILHLISLSLLLLLPFVLINNRTFPVLVALLIIAIGFLFGLDHANYPTFDYYPLLPWFGIVLLGYSLTRYYPRFRPKIFLKPPHPFVKPISFLGRHSLPIYLLHQPILFGLLFLVKS